MLDNEIVTKKANLSLSTSHPSATDQSAADRHLLRTFLFDSEEWNGMERFNLKQQPKRDVVAFSYSELVGLRQRVRHRLDHRENSLTAKEHSFLMHMYDLLAYAKGLTFKQADWLIAILERTEAAQ